MTMSRKKAALILILLAAIAIVAMESWRPGSGNRTVNSTLEIFFLNVSQGDSIFLRNGNYTMLIDCGRSDKGKEISAYLAGLDVYKIDYLIMTHTDSDHIGGCAEILRKFFVKNVIVDGQKRETHAYIRTIAEIDDEKLIVAKKYDELLLGEAEMRILHANTGSDEPNQNSIVLVLYFGNFSALLAADCDGRCEADLLNENIDADVLKVAHHGSKYATSSVFLGKVTPELAVIEVGENNYGHPANETLERLRAAGAEILRTDLNGTIVLRTNGSGYYIH